jgi:HD superfamily phosphodiesterase
MQSVAHSSYKICRELYEYDASTHQLFKKTLCVAWLHDVADHKYDFDGELKKKLSDFLAEHFPEEHKILEEIISRISYSREVKSIEEHGKVDWEEVLGQEEVLIRNIVSDADKLEALGVIGLKRCLEYTKHAYKGLYKSEMPKDKLVDRVKRHAEEKLLHLKDAYIRTEPGKKLAQPLHDELVESIKELEKKPWLYD